MVYKANYEIGTGRIVGWYREMIHSTIPEPTIDVTEEEYIDFFVRNQRFKVVEGRLVFTDLEQRNLIDVKAAAWTAIKFERDRRERAGFSYLGNRFDSDLTSAQRIALAAQAAQLALEAGDKDFSIDWTLADNAQRKLSAEQVCGMAVALAENSNALHQTARKLRERINEAQTTADVEKIGWPSDAQ